MLRTATVRTTTDALGAWRLRLTEGEHMLRVSHPGYEDVARAVRLVGAMTDVDITLIDLFRHTETVVVQAIRADAKAPITKTDIDREEIERLDYGQEMPFLLEHAPSITSYSDTGLGAGYSYFFLRGIQQTRINMTLDGAPLNDPEESAVYFANFGDFSSAVGSIQIQRGVGTSTVGAATYGGSINFTSVDPQPEPAFSAQAGAGSFGARRGALTLQTGRLPGDLAFYARASFRETDGFKEHSSVRQRALYFGLSRQDSRSVFKLSGFSGQERQQLAFLATEESVLKDDPRFNALSPDERDSFGQDFLQAQYTRFLGQSSSLAAQVYYNGARGWFRLWDDPVARTALLQYGLSGYFVGSVVSFNHASGPVSVTGGAHYGFFTRDHVLDVVGGERVYLNTGRKSEGDAFAKLGYDGGPWHLYADGQLRWARFRYEGDVPLGSVAWTFFNPRIGARRDLSPRLSVYASLAKATREPARSDLLAGEDNASIRYDLETVKPERVVDLEAGLEYRGTGLDLLADLYAMRFRDEIALTGELSEIGLPVRRNVDRSERTGLELSASWQVAPSVRLRGNANVSRNRIRRWTQFYDVYDEAEAFAGQTHRTQENVPPLLTPERIANLGAEWTPEPQTSLALGGRYVSRSQLDNTGHRDFRTPAYFAMDASASFGLGRWTASRATGLVPPVALRIQIDNVLDDRRIWPSGYSYRFLERDARGVERPSGIRYYYPLASRSVFVTLDVRL